MDKLRIQGPTSLRGEIVISGSKNATLPILAATLLTSDPMRIVNVPRLRDVTTMNLLLSKLGATVEIDEDQAVEIAASHITHLNAPYDLVRTMRASFLVLGPLLARFGRVEVSLPGGCAIGTRPIDQHLKGLRAMGAVIALEDGYVVATIRGRLQGCRIAMDVVTVTGTQNILMAATLAEGQTIIENAAREPEVCELARCLTNMGAKIEGAGTDVITIQGVKELHGCEHTIGSDRIEAGTFLVAAAATRGSITLRCATPKLLGAVLSKLSESGSEITVDGETIHLNTHGVRPKAVDIRTAVYPGMPTDLQAQFLALNAVANGTSRITETIFENRFMHVQELIRLGADISMDSTTTAVIRGVNELQGAPVMATDLRASSSLIIGGLVATGNTVVDRIYHIDRGYERIEEKLRSLGANVDRVS